MTKALRIDQLPGSFFGPANLVDLLRHRARHQTHDSALVYLGDGENETERLTYEQVDRRARAIAATLQQQGLAGERALLLFPPGLDFITAFFGCMYAGVVAVTAYPPRRNRNMGRIEAIAGDADAAIALTTDETLERVQRIISETPKLQRLAWMATDRTSLQRADEWETPDVHGDSLALLQYTSGSTGTPKGVMLSHANLMHNSAMINYAFEPSRSGCGVFWLPSYHDMGLVGGILQPMYCGGPNVIFSPAAFLQKPIRWLKAITRYRAAISGGPNFAYDLCVEKIPDEEVAGLDLSTWTLAFNGAEPVRSETLDRFTAKFAPAGFRRDAFYPCYGLAEATLIVSGGLKNAPPLVRWFESEALERHEVVQSLRDEEGARELIGCGGDLLDQQIVIVDPESQTTCPAGRIGEVWVSGPSIAQGYWKRPESTKEVFQAYLQDTGAGPFLRTGDLGFMLEGELFVTGRRKDLIILRGVNHYPQDIEHTVGCCHELLRRNAGAAFTIGRDGDEQLAIVHEVQRRGDLNTNAVVIAIRRAVAASHELAVASIVLIKAGSIPKTSSGKIQRHACRTAFEEGTLKVVTRWDVGQAEPTRVAKPLSENGRGRLQASPAKPSRVADIVFEQVRRVAKGRVDDLDLDTNIVEMGLDSLERMEIAASLEEIFGGRFPEDVLAEIETCAEVVAAIEKHMGTEPRQKPVLSKDVAIPRETYDFAHFPEIQQFRRTLHMVQREGLENPYFQVHESVIDDTTIVDGRELINFASFNYLGLSGDVRVSEAAKAAIDQYGTSVSASRLVSGEKTVHLEVERAVADFSGTEDAAVFVSGHGTNESTIGHLLGPGDLILHDALAHNSIVQGSILSGARRRPFAHNDWRHCEYLLHELRHEYRRVLIAIEGVYSMDGDYPDLPKFLKLKQRYKALLLVDEAHSIGTMGPHGRGISEHFETDPREIDILMGTISKALGSTGGYITGRKELVQYLKYTAPAFVFATGISPAAAAAALEALHILEEEPERVARLSRNSALFLKLAAEQGMNTGYSQGTPVIPVILGNSRHCMMASRALFERGFNVQPILHPAVEESAARLRYFISASHTEEQIRQVVDATVEVLREIDLAYVGAAVVADTPSPGNPVADTPPSDDQVPPGAVRAR